MHSKLIWPAILLMFCGQLLAGEAVTAPAAKVGVGLPAPKLVTGGWLKGEPVERFEPGKIYVIEFWATWCSYCRTDIPHLTALQKQYPEVVVIGQDVSGRDPKAQERYGSTTERFVAEQGEKMGYRVALDTPDEYMWREWALAAGQKVTPCVWIIGRDGKVEWIGYPTKGLDEALARVVAGQPATTQPAE